jgi:hypothetical protein
VTSTTTSFDLKLAPCGQHKSGETEVTEDHQGLITENVRYECGCLTAKEEYHDGSVHMMVVHHKGKVLVDQELRGE